MDAIKNILGKWTGVSGVFLLFLSFNSCRTDTDYLREVDYNKLRYVIADNYNLSTFNAALGVTAYDALLAEPGPFTVLVPSNTAFLNAGLGADNIRLRSLSENAALLNYHILEGRYDLNSLPFLFNQEIQTRLGVPIYVSRWVQQGDTVVTINGASVFVQHLSASNGVAQVIDQLLEPNVFANVLDVIRSRKDLTLFAQILQRSGMVDYLSNTPTCTVFAPDNEAIMDLGYTTLEQVNAADAEDLKALVAYHIVESRRFVNDFALTINYTQNGTYPLDFYDASSGNVVTANGRDSQRGELNVRMYDTGQVRLVYSKGQITVGQQAVDAYRLSLYDERGIETIVSPRHKNLVAENGCVHIIDRVLRHL